MLIGICGLIGSGKDTIANHLVSNYSYERYSWAMPLKDITAQLFGWDREMLEGTTPEQRIQREQVDPWWDKNLDKYKLWSPRYALQFLGTEVMRNCVHKDIWVLAGMKRIEGKPNVVIPDTRFPNEVEAIRKMGGQIWNVQRGELPQWYHALTGFKASQANEAMPMSVDNYMWEHFPDVHASEYSWHGTKFDVVFTNDGTIQALRDDVDSVIRNQLGAFTSRQTAEFSNTV